LPPFDRRRPTGYLLALAGYLLASASVFPGQQPTDRQNVN
jgi:hypothetical protein